MTDRPAALAAKLARGHGLSPDEYAALIDARTPALADELAGRAREVCEAVYGDGVFARGLIEFTNICANDCYYCGIRRSNRACERYRLTGEQILACAEEGWQAGFRTFVLQGRGRSGGDRRVAGRRGGRAEGIHPGCAVTLCRWGALGESYERLRAAGGRPLPAAPRDGHGRPLPAAAPGGHDASAPHGVPVRLARGRARRGRRLHGGLPFQTTGGWRPTSRSSRSFAPRCAASALSCPIATPPFAAEAPGTVELTCYLLSLVRLAHPTVLLPATTALEALDPSRPRKGHSRRGQRRDAELVAARAPGRLRTLRWEALVGRRGPQWPTWRRSLSPLGRRLVVDRGDPLLFRLSAASPAAVSAVSSARAAGESTVASAPVSSAAAATPVPPSVTSFPSGLFRHPFNESEPFMSSYNVRSLPRR